jgi:hypothetical protein
MKALFLLLLASPAFGQVTTYTAIQIVSPPAVGTAVQEPGINQLANAAEIPAQTMATYTNGSIYIGWFDLGNGPAGALVWFGGLTTVPYVLQNLIVGAVRPTGMLHFDGVCGIDQNGNIVVEGDDYTTNPPTPAYWLLIPSVNPLQAQLTHVTSEMNFYKNGVVNWEAQALAWQARAYYWCKAAKGNC